MQTSARSVLSVPTSLARPRAPASLLRRIVAVNVLKRFAGRDILAVVGIGLNFINLRK